MVGYSWCGVVICALGFGWWVVGGGLDCDFFSLFSVFTSSGVGLLVGVGLVFCYDCLFMMVLCWLEWILGSVLVYWWCFDCALLCSCFGVLLLAVLDLGLWVVYSCYLFVGFAVLRYLFGLGGFGFGSVRCCVFNGYAACGLLVFFWCGWVADDCVAFGLGYCMLFRVELVCCIVTSLT